MESSKPSPVEAGAASPRGRPDVVFRPLKDEWVILDPVVDRVHVLNLTAALVWLSCDGSRTLEAIAEGVWEDYDRAPSLDRIRIDVAAALAEFAAQGLLE